LTTNRESEYYEYGTEIAMKIRFRLSSAQICQKALNLYSAPAMDKKVVVVSHVKGKHRRRRINMIFRDGGRGKINGVNWAPANLCLIPLIFMLASFYACAPSVNEPGTWDHLLERQHQELLDTAKSIDRLASDLPERLANLEKRLYLLRSRFEIVMLYFDLRSGNPLLLRDLMDVLGWFERRAKRLISPFKQEKTSVDRLVESLTDLSRKLKQEGHPMAEKARPDREAKVKAYLKDLTSLQVRLQPISLRLNRGFETVEGFMEVLKKNRTQIEQESSRALETHLLKRVPGFFSATAWSTGFNSARKWTSRFGIYLLEPIDLKGLGWWIFLSKIVLFSLALIGMSAIFLKRIRKRSELLSGDVRLAPFFLCCSISAGAMLAISATGLFPSSFFSTAITAILVYGFISLSKNLRRLLFPDHSFELHSLIPLWAAVSAASLFEALHLPEETFIPVWSFWLLVLFWYYARTGIKRKGWANVPRIILAASMPILAMMAFLGWGYLSVLLGMLLLLFNLNFRLARCISAGLGRIGLPWHHKKSASKSSATTQVRGLGFPLIFLTLILLSLAWIFLFMGGGSLFLEVIRYRVGWKNFTFSINRVICIFSLMFAVRAGIALARSGLSRLPERYRDLDAGSVQSLDTIVTYVLWSVFALATLGLMGLSFRNLAVIAGGLSVGLGFGLQNIVNNFIGGLILLFGRSIQPGDLVEIDNIRGQVQKVTIRNTLVKSFSGATIFVPNSLLISQKMTNWSHTDRRYRQEIKIGVAYGSNVEKVTELLLLAAKQSAKVLDRPPPRVRFLDFGDNTLVFSLRLWIKGWGDRYADSEVRYHIDRIFRENNIEISFPQLDLHIRSAEGLKDLQENNSQKT